MEILLKFSIGYWFIEHASEVKMNTYSSSKKYIMTIFMFASITLLAGCGAGGDIGKNTGDWYFNWNCNGDTECLKSQPGSYNQESGTLNKGPNKGDCNQLYEYAYHYWGSAATYSCDQLPTGSTDTGSSAITISNFSPTVGVPGNVVTITGTNFPTSTSQITVAIDGQAASVVTATSTSIAITLPYVPNVTGPIVITTPSGKVTSHSSFTLVNHLYGIAWDGAQYVAVGGSGTVLTSSDGDTWNLHTINAPAESYIDAISWSAAGNQFVAVGSGGLIATSSDGTTWTIRTSHTAKPLNGIATSGSEYVAVGISGTILISPNGINWAEISSGTANTLNAVTWSGTEFLIVGENGTILTSPDGNTWTPQSSSATDTFYGITWSGSQFVAVEGNNIGVGTIHTSTDGVTWNARNSDTSNALYSVSWSGSKFAALGYGGTIVTSSDGTTWTRQSSAAAATHSLRALVWANSQFVAVGDYRTIITSPDGTAWTAK
ncbi:MAG: IPT/TIG domain-containing protein [Sciscionella sp.]